MYLLSIEKLKTNIVSQFVESRILVTDGLVEVNGFSIMQSVYSLDPETDQQRGCGEDGGLHF